MVINEYLGIGLKGLLITAFLAAFMSTIDTHLNWGASFLTIDLYKRFYKKDADERHYVRASKLFMVLLMAAGALIASMVQSVSGVMEWLAYLMIPEASPGAALVLVADQRLHRTDRPGRRTDRGDSLQGSRSQDGHLRTALGRPRLGIQGRPAGGHSSFPSAWW